MNELQKITNAQAAAPSFLRINNDGAVMLCRECNKRDTEPHIKCFTPDGKNHFSVHITCVDPEWLAIAKDMGTF